MTASGTFKEITGLRGLAALIVFISHCANEGYLPGLLGHGLGQLGVMLFFILSGFLISFLYLDRDFKLSSIKDYALARIGRVVPLYIAIAVLAFFGQNAFEAFSHYRLEGMSSFLEALFFIKAPSILWTVPVEVQFYVIFVGFWFFWSHQRMHKYTFVYVVLTLLPALAFITTPFPRLVSCYAPFFFLGVGSAILYKKKLFELPSGKPLALMTILSFAFFALSLPDLRSATGLTLPGFFKIWGDPLTVASIFGLFICALYRSKLLGFLNIGVFQFLGKISYGFYLIHLPVLMWVQSVPVMQNMGGWAIIAITFIITSVIAQLSLTFFETPAKIKIRK